MQTLQLNSTIRAKSLRRLLVMIMVLALCLSSVPASYAGNGGLSGANVKDGVILGYYGEGGDIVIPNTITQIAGEAFKGNDNITSITIPGSVSSIGYSAFAGCTELEKIIFSDPKDGADLTIRVNAFSDCPKLKECVIPACAEYVTANVFEGCTSMKKIEVDPDNPYYMTDDEGVMFGPWVKEGEPQYQDPNLTLTAYPSGREYSSYDIPEEVNGRTVNRIWAGSFSKAINLKHINIPETVTIIGGYAFCDSGIEEMTIPETVTDCDAAGLFEGCTNLKEVTIPSTMTQIAQAQFNGCTSLQKINFPSSGGPVQIAVGAFANCKSLTNLIIPNSVAVIGIQAFKGCSNLQRIYFPASVTSFPNIDGDILDAFEDASSELKIYVVPNSTGAKWAAAGASDFGWNYETVNGLSDLADKDIGSFALTDMGKKIKLTGEFKMGSFLDAEDITSGEAYKAFSKAADNSVLKVFKISVDQEAELPDSMNLAVARPAGMTSSAKLYSLESGAVTPLDTTAMSGTLMADVSELGYFAIIDGSVAGGEKDPTAPTSVSLNKKNVQLQVGKTLQLSATVLPSTATNKSVTWSSENEKIASVSTKGVVTANEEGKTKIVATAVNGVKGYCEIEVIGEKKPEPETPTGYASVDAAYVKAALQRTEKGQAAFSLNLKNSSRVATLEVTLETDGSDMEIVGKNGFTSLGKAKETTSDGKYLATFILCYLQGDDKQLTSSGETEIAEITVSGNKPVVSIKSMKISGWNTDGDVAYGEIADVDGSGVVFTGEKSYDLNGDGKVDILDITFAQGFYRAAKGDSNWAKAESCDFNNDDKVDVEDLILAMMHFKNLEKN